MQQANDPQIPQKVYNSGKKRKGVVMVQSKSRPQPAFHAVFHIKRAAQEQMPINLIELKKL